MHERRPAYPSCQAQAQQGAPNPAGSTAAAAAAAAVRQRWGGQRPGAAGRLLARSELWAAWEQLQSLGGWRGCEANELLWSTWPAGVCCALSQRGPATGGAQLRAHARQQPDPPNPAPHCAGNNAGSLPQARRQPAAAQQPARRPVLDPKSSNLLQQLQAARAQMAAAAQEVDLPQDDEAEDDDALGALAAQRGAPG